MVVSIKRSPWRRQKIESICECLTKGREGVVSDNGIQPIVSLQPDNCSHRREESMVSFALPGRGFKDVTEN